MDLTEQIKVFQSACCNGWHCKHEECFVGDVLPLEPDIRQFCDYCRMGIYHLSQKKVQENRDEKSKHAHEGPQFLYTGYQYCDGVYKYEYVNSGEYFGSCTEPLNEMIINCVGLEWLSRREEIQKNSLPKASTKEEKDKKQTTIDKFFGPK
ncbi:Hypothetical predicted protein [Paramuricea clavata]|uniref:Uncharacterized protein n=1 Tax=Paramuricea clavata TaxID=317549 RepID=A0A7D9DT15_PARCT|nr:Hypothetical predicted protein [Paramuricea clavata]